MERILLKTPLGTAEICGDNAGISKIEITDEEGDLEVSGENQPVLSEAAEQLGRYFSGELREFSLRLNPAGTPFQLKVWNVLSKIPYGKTISYSALSAQLGDIKAIRAVAAANAKNPLWIVVPCHRVIGSDGSLTGYAGGIHRKKWLLEHENPSLQQRLF